MRRPISREKEALLRYIETTYWNETLGFFVDSDPQGKLTDVLTPAGLWPVLAGAGSAEQRARIFGTIRDPNRFWRPHVIPSVSADHPTYYHAGNYWQGSVWPPMVMLAIRAARKAAYHALAVEISENHLRNLTEVYRDTGTLWENYAPESARRGNVSRPEFVGWSGCGPIEALVEVIIGIEVDASTDTVTWTSSRDGTHGVRNLRMKGAPLSLIFEPSTGRLTYETAATFTLRFHRGGTKWARSIAAGSGTIEVES